LAICSVQEERKLMEDLMTAVLSDTSVREGVENGEVEMEKTSAPWLE
jgi:hypothetical protein